MQSNTAALGNQCINFATISVENRASDPITVVDGRYVGHDGFVAPRDFAEFYERFPQHVRNWVARHVDRSTPKQDVEDWTQDLLIHLHCLPPNSKHRESGKQDVVQTFDPIKQYGASRARFPNGPASALRKYVLQFCAGASYLVFQRRNSLRRRFPPPVQTPRCLSPIPYSSSKQQNQH